VNSRPSYESASGLRPASAFFVIAFVLGLAAIWVGTAAIGAEAPELRRAQVERDPPPAYAIVDGSRRPMALFVQRLDLVMSPNAMWQAHTPAKIAEGIAGVLGGIEVPELARRMFPDAKDGVITTSLPLDGTQAARIQNWLATGSPEGDGQERPIDGMWIGRTANGANVLCWRPADLLSEDERVYHDELYAEKPLKWARHIADGLAASLMGLDALHVGDDELELETQRADVWSWLLPSTYCVAVRGFDASRAPELIEFLSQNHVASHQMRIERGRDREYPSGKFEILGSWGYVDPSEAAALSAAALGETASEVRSAAAAATLVDDRIALDTAERAIADADDEESYARAWAELTSLRARATWDLLAQPLPVSGLERACDRLLGDDDAWGFLERERAQYGYFRHRAVRSKSARTYYVESIEASETPRIVTTFDVMLQRQVGLALDDAMAEHKPALAMAIAIELASGDVLAVDSRSAYAISGFAPLIHEFTPGSTFKVNVMACALESGAVEPSQRFDVGNRSFVLGPRTIHEAESSKTGILTAAECLAHSVNAGLAQIGLRVPAEFLHSKLLALHYAQAPRAGFGGERDGYLPNLPWTRFWTHASISFGHELKVTLWQHAAGLAAIVRGGEWRPLRVLDAVEQNGERFELPHAQPERVFTPETAATVREMMMLGAREGTGKPVAAPEKLPGLVVGTKTGTAQKVGGEVCLHVELADQVAHWKANTRCSRNCRKQLAAASRDHGSCYTSSMCVWGRVDGSEREVMVLVVIDEPRGGQKYGSRVAGPTAVRILREALGATRNGVPTESDLRPGFAASSAKSQRGHEQPWAEVRW
jgi:cell division protein FtsI/penicillin-binding protein 2